MAAPALDQTTWLEKHGVVADEIALDFDHAFRMAKRLAEEGFLDRDALPDLRMHTRGSWDHVTNKAYNFRGPPLPRSRCGGTRVTWGA
ncbi:hypothetical protein [Streptomyces sp. CA-106110]|uniref:hypothetical protein n=1 Tax=Streptomyces sp. CA-106110 TaxID=3240044 RepID=UPI003D8E1381